MKRRTFMARSAAVFGSALLPGACAVQRLASENPADRRVALSSVRRLLIERSDPLLGRCHYVADTGSRLVARPILYARGGDLFDALIENRLPQPSTVHFHGLTLPESADGAGFTQIAPGANKQVRFQVRNRAGLYFLHSHAHGFTAEQVHSGLAAVLLVGDAEDQALDAALALGPANRLALALADVRATNGILMPYAPREEECLHGWYGNRVQANAEFDASYTVAPGWVRLQLLNACNARGMLLGFRDTSHPDAPPQPFHLLGTDGGLLAAPRRLERVFLYSAERIDIAIALQPGAKLQAVSLAFDPRHQVRGKWQKHMLHAARGNYPPLAAAEICSTGGSRTAALGDGVQLPLFSLVATAPGTGDHGTAKIAALPLQLSSLNDATLSNAAPARRVRLDFDEQNGFLIDNRRYHIDEAGYLVTRGSREIWEIRNSPISMPHAMHLHNFGLRVLRRQGTFGPARALATESQGRLPTDLGIKDTVVIWPNETVWLEIDFSLPDDDAFRGPQRYMFHCHNLEHEDGMMMRNITVA